MTTTTDVSITAEWVVGESGGSMALDGSEIVHIVGSSGLRKTTFIRYLMDGFFRGSQITLLVIFLTDHSMTWQRSAGSLRNILRATSLLMIDLLGLAIASRGRLTGCVELGGIERSARIKSMVFTVTVVAILTLRLVGG